jgi:hypothetical protein
LLAITFLLTSCDLQRLTVNQTADVLYAGSVALDREPDVDLGREAIPASLKTLETFLVSAPDNEKLLELLARGYYSYAFAFLEGDLERAQVNFAEEKRIENLRRRCLIHYLRARDYGFRLLDMPELEKAARDGDLEKLEKELQNVEKDDVPGLFWAGYGWASAINLNQADTDMVASLGTVEIMMKRVEQLDTEYFSGGVLYFFGVYYASRPAMFGGKPELAKEYFERAMKKYGSQNQMIPFLYARFYAPSVQDRELFVELMHGVATAQVEEYPNLRLNNEVARQRATFWLENMDELIYE